jgi:arylsulfatase A
MKHLLFLLALCPLFAAAVPPNILVILIDDLGWKDLSCYGSNYYRTPNIDQLAAEGVLRTRNPV